MKRLCRTAFILLALMTGVAHAEEPRVLLNGVEATGAGQMYAPYYSTNHTVAITFTNSGGSVTALTVDLEGSIDGVAWFQIASHTLTSAELTAMGAMFHVVNKRVHYVRANITTLTETGTTAVTVKYVNKEEK